MAKDSKAYVNYDQDSKHVHTSLIALKFCAEEYLRVHGAKGSASLEILEA